jgi:hypothetical protein
MNKKIYFDHCYSIDEGHNFLNILEGMGFVADHRVTEHPNVMCKFIFFKNNRYIEFVHKLSGSETFTPSGFSFGYSDSINTFKEELETNTTLKTSLVHKNYDWKNNDNDLLPGWDYLNFENTNFPLLHLWFTQYGPRPNSTFDVPVHPNGATEILGHNFIVNKEGRDFFSTLLNQKIQDEIILNDGTVLHFKDGAKNHHSAVLIHSNEDLSKYVDGNNLITNGSLCIKNPVKGMWDIVLTNKKLVSQ